MTEDVKIRVTYVTRKALKALGKKGETYDGIIRNLMEDSRLYREVLEGGESGLYRRDLEEVKE